VHLYDDRIYRNTTAVILTAMTCKLSATDGVGAW